MLESRLNHAINVTPLADVMLVLLIIFMVVTPMIGSGVEVDVPDSAHPTELPQDDDELVLALPGDGSLWLNETRVARAEIDATMAERLARHAQKIVLVKAGESLDYGYVLEMMDVCRRAGAEGVALVTREIDDETARE